MDRQAVMLADLEDLRGALERGDVPSMQVLSKLNMMTASLSEGVAVLCCPAVFVFALKGMASSRLQME